jgi:Antirestriction protein
MKSYPIKTGEKDAFLYALASNYSEAIVFCCNTLKKDQCTDIDQSSEWNFRALSKKTYDFGGFIYPAIDNPVTMQSRNGWRGVMSPEACGIALSMTAFSWLSFEADSKNDRASVEALSRSYYHLRDAAYGKHREAAKIAAFLD